MKNKDTWNAHNNYTMNDVKKTAPLIFQASVHWSQKNYIRDSFQS